MFERSILRDHLAETGDGLALRELAWADLVARLAATRELRGALARSQFLDGGGFELFAQVRQSAAYEGKRRVNRNALADGKIDGAKGTEQTADHAGQSDRETE